MTNRAKIQNRMLRNKCIRCGTCCMKGGPTLHHEDKNILLKGHAGHRHLITIRKGEWAFNPVNNRLDPVRQEMIKVIGKGKDWSCFFYDVKQNSCKIYSHRFLECRLLKCWDTSEIMSVIGRDTLIRTDIINPGDPIIKVIETHEQQCSYDEVGKLISKPSREKDSSKHLAKLTELVRKDLTIRFFARSELGLKEEFEPFIFGRPLYKVLSSHGLSVPTS